MVSLSWILLSMGDLVLLCLMVEEILTTVNL